ncbi:uncharacterized protein N7511_003959 [Penicillium nucicola]|uniref:uncharacterized protein n=1 Tax=Penicillium nucicola TaxID=1850975 RepID=UPI002544EF88|nr:uncharacterized protein N7511_003959 [Penicillium nucicola]KAJ5766343.1 hypothetical protein N7511_003959 [Penicillium nucicola]
MSKSHQAGDRAGALEDSCIAVSVSKVRFKDTQADGEVASAGMLGTKASVNGGTCCGCGGECLIVVVAKFPGSLYPESIVEIEDDSKSTLQSIFRAKSSQQREETAKHGMPRISLATEARDNHKYCDINDMDAR